MISDDCKLFLDGRVSVGLLHVGGPSQPDIQREQVGGREGTTY